MTKLLPIAVATAIIGSAPALAHVTLENQQAHIGAGYKAVFRVPHGCDGTPTVRLRVQIPEGVIGVKPMPKPGWKVEIIKGKLAKPYDDHGKSISEGVTEVVWSGGNLPDEHYDEFVLRANLTHALKPDTTLYFPVVQECDKGVERWIEIPAEGKRAGDYQRPAPGLKLLPKK
jgi:uncharacterized protein YcnI